MKIVTDIKEWQIIRKNFSNQKIGFIPTMGNLHRGHLSLCNRSKLENEMSIVSIYVNQTQFNEVNDFNNYPRTLSQDIELLEKSAIDYLFLPDEKTMYPDNFQIQITETTESLELEGSYRSGHFTGMLTIVLKLFNLIQPQKAYFGEKDFQQLILIKKLVQALFLPIEIINCETIREKNGLAYSSRNNRLTNEQRKKAASFPKWLKEGENPVEITKNLEKLGFKVDYIKEKWQRRLGAVWLDNIRLIDNIPL